MEKYISKIRDKYSNYTKSKYSFYINYICSAVLTVFVLAYFIFGKPFEESLGNAVGIALGLILAIIFFRVLKKKRALS